jgi:hypothetical protein
MVYEKMVKKVGCRVKGTFYMHFLSNHFHIGFGNHQMLRKVANHIKKNKGRLVMDLSHIVHEMTFGSKHQHENTLKK